MHVPAHRARFASGPWRASSSIYLALVAVGLSPARAPNASRYVYMGGILSLLLIAELCRDISWSTAAGLVAFVFLGLSLMANVAELRAGGHLFGAEGDDQSGYPRGAGAEPRPGRSQTCRSRTPRRPIPIPTCSFPPGPTSAPPRSSARPPTVVDQLLAAGAQAREAADQELVRALGIVAEPGVARRLAQRGAPPEALAADAGIARPLGACLSLIPNPGGTATFQIELPPGGLSLRSAPGAEVELKLARFADQPLEALSARSPSGEVAIPRDASPTPWRAELVTETKTLACHR